MFGFIIGSLSPPRTFIISSFERVNFLKMSVVGSKFSFSMIVSLFGCNSIWVTSFLVRSFIATCRLTTFCDTKYSIIFKIFFFYHKISCLQSANISLNTEFDFLPLVGTSMELIRRKVFRFLWLRKIRDWTYQYVLFSLWDYFFFLHYLQVIQNTLIFRKRLPMTVTIRTRVRCNRK